MKRGQTDEGCPRFAIALTVEEDEQHRSVVFKLSCGHCRSLLKVEVVRVSAKTLVLIQLIDLLHIFCGQFKVEDLRVFNNP